MLQDKWIRSQVKVQTAITFVLSSFKWQTSANNRLMSVLATSVSGEHINYND